MNYLPSKMQFVPHLRLKEEECQKALDMVEETLVMEAVVYEALKAVKVLEVVLLEALKAVEVLEAVQAVQALEMHQFVPVHELDVPHLANTIYPMVLEANLVDVVDQLKENVSPFWTANASPRCREH